MDDKSYSTFAKRKKKKVNGKINKEKFKKNIIKNDKYVKVSTLNKNISKKTFLHTLFKSFIKPYNERNTAFYSILCIINNIYKCTYFNEHRCFICKSLYEDTSKQLEEKKNIYYYYSSDGDDNNFPYNIYYNIRKINLNESNKTSKNSSNSNKIIVTANKNNAKTLNSCLLNECPLFSDTSNLEYADEERKKNDGTTEDYDESKENVKNMTNVENCNKVKMNVTLRHFSNNNKSNNINNNNNKSQNINNNNNNNSSSENQLCACPVQNFVNVKLNFTNSNQYHFLSHEKSNFVDIYNFKVFDKISMYDKILLDLNQNEIHPNILRTGIFFNKCSITTHNHRNVDLLTALKSFIKDYTLPPYEPINKHMKIVIDKEINYIIMCKKHSVSMGEVIRWFKNMISEHIGKNVLEETKEIITNNINNYIRTKIVIPSINISNYVSNHIIENNDVILIYTFDYDIYLSILKAKRNGKNFEIILVDSEPYKNSYNIKLYTKLGISVTYTLIGGLFYNIRRCTKVLLGIDAIIHNSVYGHVGTSIICMMSNINNVDVYIVCETYKISNKILIDSFSMNNINNNLDIYDYMYMHHYHHHSNPHKCDQKCNKNVEGGTNFNKKLNNFIHSFSDIKKNNILFNNINTKYKKPTVRYVSTSVSAFALKKKAVTKKKKKKKEEWEGDDVRAVNEDKKVKDLNDVKKEDVKNEDVKNVKDVKNEDVKNVKDVKKMNDIKEQREQLEDELKSSNKTLFNECTASLEDQTRENLKEKESQKLYIQYSNERITNEMKMQYESKIEHCDNYKSSSYTRHIETTKLHESTDTLVKCENTTNNSESNITCFTKNFKEEKTNITDVQEKHVCQMNNINDVEMEKKKLKTKEEKISLNYVKEVNTVSSNSTFTTGSTKSILKQQTYLSHEIKNEKTMVKINYKNISQTISSDNNNNNNSKVINKKNKVFFNLKNDRNNFEQSTYSLNFKNHFDIKSSNINTSTDQNINESDKDQMCCNDICHSICKSIGNVNIKNVCTDKHNDTNLFTSVFSHINKINSNNDKSFYVANICNDVTPLKYINYIVTEVGLYTSSNKNALNAFIHNNI
ncbi:initiation factor 2 subunit family, putative [Plasmodium gaboni]|uniref:Translation initiation factor eIF2B subunit delta n=1 Tax=Plasmodium gaboni TaxID=647221 RepID=A0ABY1UMS5_9APIC|nr:initiation factor 2 subunit family, putative [Plasmodium gaboni]